MVVVCTCMIWCIAYVAGRSLKIQDYEDKMDEMLYMHQQKVDRLRRDKRDAEQRTKPEIQRRVKELMMCIKIPQYNEAEEYIKEQKENK